MRCLFSFALLLFVIGLSDLAFAISGVNAIRKSPQYQAALATGAVAELRILVKDENGEGVSNANVRAVFDMTTYVITKEGMTDVSGECMLRGKTRGNAIDIRVDKVGYYGSSKKICLVGFKNAHAVENGTWQPTPIVVSLSLKGIHSPIRAKSHGGTYHLPATNQWCGFDLIVGDWLKPMGTGVCADIEFNLKWYGENPMNWQRRDFSVRFAENPCNGGYKELTQTESEFPYSYEADAARGYLRAFQDSASRDERKLGMLDGAQDFVFRFRCVTNEMGQLVSCNYGRFRKLNYGHERSGQGVLTMRYDYNEKANDTNLEFSGRMENNIRAK